MSRAYFVFQSTRPLRGATSGIRCPRRIALISIHAPLTGRDVAALRVADGGVGFQSTRPLRGATLQVVVEHVFLVISIHAPLTGRDAFPDVPDRYQRISIHAPLTGHDAQNKPFFFFADWISIHAPLTGRDHRGRLAGRRQGQISIHVPRTGHDSKNAQIVFCIFAITDNKSGKVIM